MTDVSKPNVARVYDYLLGGSNNFPADRAAADGANDPSPTNYLRLIALTEATMRSTPRET